MEHLSNDHKDRSNQQENSYNLYDEFDRKSMETETATWSEFPNGRKAIAEQTLASKETNKFKREEKRESKSGIRQRKLII